MSDSAANANVHAENRLLRETLAWIVKNSIDSAVRVRARDVLRQVDPRVVDALDAAQNDSEIYGEWCI
jgi:hypothetical protein